MILTFRPASREEAVWLSSRLRPEDRQEVETASGRPAEVVLPHAFDASAEVYTIRLSDFRNPELDPVAIFGVVDHIHHEGMGVPWFMATYDIQHGSIALLREACYWLDAWARKYPLGLHNIADLRNTLHIRWLKLTGFEFGETITLNGHEFIHFHRSNRSV